MSSLATPDLAHVLIALAALLLCAHGMGSVFVHHRQPRAIGEIIGGLLLGPTVLGFVWPAAQAWLFPPDSPRRSSSARCTSSASCCCSSSPGRSFGRSFIAASARTVAAVFVAGMCIPFAAGLAITQMIHQQSLWGPNGNTTSFVLVFSIAMAITSIPVISRIMHDIGILDTAFASVVLGVAVLEDLVLYVVLAVAIGYAGGSGGTLFGLPSLLGIAAGSNADLLYHVVGTVAFLAAFLAGGPPAYRWIGALEWNAVQRATPVAHQLTFLILTTAVALMLGLEAFFGAFVARRGGRGYRAVALGGDACHPQLLTRLLHPRCTSPGSASGST